MTVLRRRPPVVDSPPDPDAEPLDDAEDFDIRDGQQVARDLAHTKRVMKKVFDEMFGPASKLAAYARTLRYVKVKRER